MNIQSDNENLLSEDAKKIAEHLTNAYVDLFQHKDYNLYDFKEGLMFFTAGILSSTLTTVFADESFDDKLDTAHKFCEQMFSICAQILKEHEKVVFN